MDSTTTVAMPHGVGSDSGGDGGEPAGGLRRELGRLDTVLFLLSAMVVVDTVGAVVSGGAQALTWMLVLGLTFFVPSALVTAELGAALPDEGGAYVWVREAFGRSAGALASFLYWAGTPVWVGGSVAVVAVTAVDRFVTPLDAAGRLLVGAVVVLAATAGGVVPLRYGKWVPNSGAVAQVALLTFFTVTALGYGAQHGFHPPTLASARPTSAVFVAVVPVLFYSFVGLELPSAAGGEMRDPRRDVPAAILRAGIVQVLMYGAPVLAILTVLPAAGLTSLAGFVDALRAVLTVYGGGVGPDGQVVLTGAGAALSALAAVVLVWVLLASACTWMMGGARVQAVACADGGGPRTLGTVSARTGVPVRMTLVTGGAALAVLGAGLLATGADAQRYFTVTLVGTIAFESLTFLLVYPAFLRLRVARPGLERPFRAPGGTLAAAGLTVLAGAWTVVVSACLLWPGLGWPDPDRLLPAGFEGRRAEFELLVGTPVAVVLAAFAVHRFVAARSARTGAVPAPRPPRA